ncbi:inositol monophosphatase [bacterium]|nr:inositol monophosphatase [bacterium]
MENARQLLVKSRKMALEAGEILRDGFGRLKSGDVALKGFGDYVTAMDHASENLIINAIKKSYPNHRIYAEESGMDDQNSDYIWLIDPLDGTANYVHGIPWYSVSIAVQKKNRLLAGVVYHVEYNELFSAELGQGAFLNGKPIHVSHRESLDRAMLGTGFPWRSKPYIDAYVKTFHQMFFNAAGMRRMGSAAIDLSYVACGRLDGFWEMHLRPYDIGAGILLTQEAGGQITDFTGGSTHLNSGNIVAANPLVHRQLLEVTRKHLIKVPGIDSIQDCQ